MLTMSLSKERLIESAVRPLEDNAEMELAAKRLLSDLVPDDAPDAEKAVERWDVVDARPRKPVWRIILWAMLLIVSSVVEFHAVRIIVVHQNPIGSSPSDLFYGYPAVTDESVAANLTEEQRLLVFGDLSRSEEWERMKALWDSDPNNPVYFARYAQDYISESKTLPPDFLKIAAEIAPDNAWFTYIAVGVMAKDAVKKRQQTKAERLANKAFEWDILDQTRFDQSIAILRQARKQPRCDSYWSELLDQQLSFLPQSTPSEFAFSFIYPFRSSSAEFVLRDLANVICAEAWLAGETENITGFFQALADANDFLEKRTHAKVESLLGELINLVGAAGMTSNLSAAADQLDLDEESERLGKIQQRFVELMALKQSRKRAPTAELLYDHGGAFPRARLGYQP